MIRASALYISLIISILIVLVCGSILLIGHTYKLQELKAMRKDKLRSNLESAAVLVSMQSFNADTLFKTSLFEQGDDSVQVQRKLWGLYEIATLESWIAGDTLRKAYMLASVPKDSLAVFYLADEDRPVSISGKSLIKGTAFLPKSGIKAAYVESSGYTDKTLVYGYTKDSGRDLPMLDAGLLARLSALQQLSANSLSKDAVDQLLDSLSGSFFDPVQRIALRRSAEVSLDEVRAQGNIIISSDSAIVVGANCRLDKVILIAPYIRIEDGFKGNLQAIASDSIYAGNGLQLRYPSALVVLKNDTARFQAKLTIGNDALVEGVLMAYESERSLLMPLLQIGSETVVKGEVWSKGYVAMNKSSEVQGSVTAIRLMARVASAIYENYLIDVKLDRTRLSKYYLSPRLFAPGTQTKRLCVVQ